MWLTGPGDGPPQSGVFGAGSVQGAWALQPSHLFYNSSESLFIHLQVKGSNVHSADLLWRLHKNEVCEVCDSHD